VASQVNMAMYVQMLLRAFSASIPARIAVSTRHLFAFGCASLLLAVSLGCQRGNSTPVPSDPSMMRGVVSTYRTAMSMHGKPPESMDDMKQVLAPLSDDPGQYLRSKRDGQNFVIIWGLNLDAVPADVVVAYEQTGVDGKRMVVTPTGDVREVSAEEFAKLKFPKDHQPQG
jgi:hypothetical protein